MVCLVYSWSWSKEIPLQELARRQLGHVPWVKYLVRMTRSQDSLANIPGIQQGLATLKSTSIPPNICNDIKLLSLILGIINWHHCWLHDVDQVRNDLKLSSSLEAKICCDSEPQVRRQLLSPTTLNWTAQTLGHELCQNRCQVYLAPAHKLSGLI